MYADTYFCFCCLSTNDLINLYLGESETNYCDLIQTLFDIDISQEDYEYDGYVCNNCAQKLKEFDMFKSQVYDILHILQSNGLIEIKKSENQINIKKANVWLETNEKYENDGNQRDVVIFDGIIEDGQIKPQTIKMEDIQQNKLENFEIVQGVEIIRSTIDNSKLMLERIRSVQGNEEKDTVKRISQYEVTKDLKCSVCSVVLPNLYVYHAHMNQHYPNHICELCGKGFLTEKRLKRHMPSHMTGPFKCQTCGAEFTNYNTLNSHRQRKHSTVALYKCPHCNERFPTYTRRARHLAAAHAAPAQHYRCQLCHKRFLIAGNLSAHMRNKHFKMKRNERHLCCECGARFSQRQELVAHAATHTQTPAFRCEICHKRYPRKKALIVHMRTHTDERRFECTVCGKRFIQKCTLIVHAKTHNREEKNVKSS